VSRPALPGAVGVTHLGRMGCCGTLGTFVVDA
jgi:hypothetical protein